jgi:hypothetical protein
VCARRAASRCVSVMPARVDGLRGMNRSVAPSASRPLTGSLPSHDDEAAGRWAALPSPGRHGMWPAAGQARATGRVAGPLRATVPSAHHWHS